MGNKSLTLTAAAGLRPGGVFLCACVVVLSGFDIGLPFATMPAMETGRFISPAGPSSPSLFNTPFPDFQSRKSKAPRKGDFGVVSGCGLFQCPAVVSPAPPESMLGVGGVGGSDRCGESKFPGAREGE